MILPEGPYISAYGNHYYSFAAGALDDGLIKDVPQIITSVVVHAPLLTTRLCLKQRPVLDVLELFAFVHPAKFCIPTIKGLAEFLGIEQYKTQEDAPYCLYEIVWDLLDTLGKKPLVEKKILMGLAGPLEKEWAWAPFVQAALGAVPSLDPMHALLSHVHLSEWEKVVPVEPHHHPVTGEEARTALGEALANKGGAREERAQQIHYTNTVSGAFIPKSVKEDPAHVIVAEAGTGTGKTLGYLAPSKVWAEKNEGTVWLSTYTKNLQRQLRNQTKYLYPDNDEHNKNVCVRKGRENYICLLTWQEFARASPYNKDPRRRVLAALVSRWITATEDGDLATGDLPGWLPTLFGLQAGLGLTDRRGECIYAGCEHYQKCFIERSVWKSRESRLVIANHALIMRRAALAAETSEPMPQRYIFDEGHHIFDAADGAFASDLTGRTARDLRRWVLGAEQSTRKSRMRGLRRRLEGVVEDNESLQKHLDAALRAANVLPADGWLARIKTNDAMGAFESFLAALRTQVEARAKDGQQVYYSIETPPYPLEDSVAQSIEELTQKLSRLKTPLQALAKILKEQAGDASRDMTQDQRNRMEGLADSTMMRVTRTLDPWIAMLNDLSVAATGDVFVDWFAIDRIEGQDFDVGFLRRYIDPTLPFANALGPHAHGVGITSATLMDGEDWHHALQVSGAAHLAGDLVKTETMKSPFAYKDQARVFIINDVSKNNMDLTAVAFQKLFNASGGGAIGLFTAIQRLRGVYTRIAPKMGEGNIPLYAQHVDAIDTGTLVDLFRADDNACLLGTDAVRDGVDVPGRSLRMLIYDRVPWPRPTIVHKARRAAFGGKAYDEALTRMKIKQAFGRLIRSNNDKGVFIMLDSAMPSRLLDAFPSDVEIQRIGLDEALTKIKEFL